MAAYMSSLTTRCLSRFFIKYTFLPRNKLRDRTKNVSAEATQRIQKMQQRQKLQELKLCPTLQASVDPLNTMTASMLMGHCTRTNNREMWLRNWIIC
ncbi:hypothetical protein AAFF_G00436350 [Aldrovandia affinis]|uniref:Uncharacterized protein n=1 Tax=Aldrovandia affinis TaxID=143900 RepID=A0AAD7S7X8_9TELE|nr:hypothetical protein AAFF_G00436350 [Aldrovandia affinis]